MTPHSRLASIRRLATGIFMSVAMAMAMGPLPADAQEQTARLVRDTNRDPATYGAQPGWVSPLEKGVVFTMETLAQGYELWTSNGTPGGTRLLKEFTPGPAGTYIFDPQPFGEGAGARVAFVTAGEDLAQTIRVTDGTAAGTVSVQEPPAEDPWRRVELLDGTPGGFFFRAAPSGQPEGVQLFFSDGTAAGTRVLTPAGVADPERFASPEFHFTSGPWAYFKANGDEIWRSDGSEAGTTKVMSALIPGNPWFHPLGVAGGRLFVSSYDEAGETEELWAYPAEGGPATRLGPPEGGYPWWYLADAHVMGDRLVFTVRDFENFSQWLWVSDGTPAGTREMALPLEGYGLTSVRMMSWHGKMYVMADVWKLDDPDVAASALFCVNAALGEIEWSTFFPHGASWPEEGPWQEAGDVLYFWVLTDLEGNRDLWETKGTAKTTRRVKKVPANHPVHNTWPDATAVTRNGVYFSGPAGKGITGNALWRQRSPKGWTTRLTRPEKWTASGMMTYSAYNLPLEARPYEMTGRGNLLAFVDAGGSHELWQMKPDGNRAKAVWKTKEPLAQYGALGFWGTTASGALYTHANGHEAQQVWVTDGTRRGTRMLADHGMGLTSGFPDRFVQVGDRWFYPVYRDDAREATLWMTDGTPVGTSQVVAADGTRPGPDLRELVAFQGRLYFLAAGADGKTALWRTDGTPAGTVKVKDTWHGEAGEKPAHLSVTGGILRLVVRLPTSDTLWQSDGTAAGTVALSEPGFFSNGGGLDRAVEVNGTALFRGKRPGVQQREWWCHDAAGGLRPLQPSGGGENFPDGQPWELLHAVAGTQLFYNGQGSNGATLRVTDGISPSRQVNAEDPDSFFSPNHLVAVGDVVYFSAFDGPHGEELWRSDGTAEGTVLVADIEPGAGSSWPQDLKAMGGKLYFTAQRRDVGREIFMIELEE